MKETRLNWITATAAAAILSGTAMADLVEGFDDITLLEGQGWAFQNNSDPIGSTDWFQGNAAVFPAQAGADDAYIGANFNNSGSPGTISNWMLTPELSLNNGDSLSFWTGTSTGNTFPDRMEVRLSSAGSSTDVGSAAFDVGDFTTVILEINPALDVGGYPDDWTQFDVSISGLVGATDGRLAFRYFVEDSGPAANSNYIGIDTFSFTQTPAPGALALLGLAGLGCGRRRRG